MDTSIKSRVMRGKLKEPIQKGFSEADWNAALAEISAPTAEDLELHSAALFFGKELEGLRRFVADCPSPPGRLPSQIRRAIGVVNRAYCLAKETLRERFM